MKSSRLLTICGVAVVLGLGLAGAIVPGCASSKGEGGPVEGGFTGSSWRLASYNNGTGGAVPVLADTDISVTFGEDGNLAGLAGCNSYWGIYTTDGDQLSLGSVGSTQLFCAQPPGILEQEEAYLKALRDAATFKITGETLELRSNDGSLLASFDAWKLPPGG
ncbi:MAG: META domain-containing protein [bacterium]